MKKYLLTLLSSITMVMAAADPRLPYEIMGKYQVNADPRKVILSVDLETDNEQHMLVDRSLMAEFSSIISNMLEGDVSPNEGIPLSNSGAALENIIPFIEWLSAAHEALKGNKDLPIPQNYLPVLFILLIISI
jgi:hypothetical protein